MKLYITREFLQHYEACTRSIEHLIGIAKEGPVTVEHMVDSFCNARAEFDAPLDYFDPGYFVYRASGRLLFWNQFAMHCLHMKYHPDLITLTEARTILIVQIKALLRRYYSEKK